MKAPTDIDDLPATTDRAAEWFDARPQYAFEGVTTGELVALNDDGCTALVMFPGQVGSAAVPARTAVDLCEQHIGKCVVLTFEHGKRTLPIVVGVIRSVLSQLPPIPTANIEADGERLIVGAKERLTLRCGEASITLTKEGKVIIQGTFVSTRSSGLNRIVGGSVQIN